MANRVYVTSNNGTIHLAEDETVPTKREKPRYYQDSVRKLCDGQWVTNKKVVEAEAPTCSVCKKVLSFLGA